MSKNNNILTSLDIGTTSIKVIIAEYINDQMNIIGVGEEESKGIKKGVIVDIDKTVQSIQRAIEQAQNKANVQVTEVIVGIPAYGLDIEYSHGSVKVNDENGEIKATDIKNVLAQTMVQAVPPEKELMTVLIEEFIVDGFDDIQDPRGMVGVRLELYALVLSLPKTLIHSIKRCVNMAGLEIRDIVLQPLALGTVALTEEQRQLGTVVIDMGGGQTTASAIHDNKLKFSFVDPEGGEYVTRDIAVVLNTTNETAEQLKRHYGYASSKNASADNTMEVDIVGKTDNEVINEEFLAEIIEARMTQILTTVKKELDSIQALELPGGLVITGGNSAIPGIQDLVSELYGMPAELYIPNHMGVRYATFSTAVGLIQYVYELEEIQRVINQIVNGTYTEKEIKKSQTSQVHVTPEIESPVREEPQQDVSPQQKETGEESFMDRVKNMLESFFD